MLRFRLSKEFKNRKIRFGRVAEIEPHEAILDKLAQKKEAEMGLSEKRFEVPLSKGVLQGFFVFSLILFFFLFAKTFQLQVIDGKKYLAKAQENKYLISKIQAERGVIYDKNMNQLVFNEPSFDLMLDKTNLPDDILKRESVLEEIAKIISSNATELKNKISGSEGNISLIAEDIPHETLVVLETKIKDLPGFEIRQNLIRKYKDGEYFSHILGYTGKITSAELRSSDDYSLFDWVGKAGIEKSYENILRKSPAKLQIERDALGREVSKKIIENPQSGESLVLWVDFGLQKKITEELKMALEKSGTKKAAAIALDPKTGGVLALVSLPSFDNNLFQKGADATALQSLLKDQFGLEPLFNRAISGRYLTGSIIKPLVASAALQEKTISPDKKIYDGGFIEIRNQYDPSIVYKFKGIKPHGWVDMRQGIAVSSNIYFYTVGGGYENQQGLGPSKIKKYLQLFNWEEKTGIDLPGEKEGFVPDPEWKKKTLKEGWWDGDTYNMSIGQGYLQITPLEVAAAFSAIANGGTLYKPHVVQKIINNEEIAPEIISSNFIDSRNLQVVREGMRLGVTGENTPDALVTLLNSLPVGAAAKTGTAELGSDYNNNWISVFAPYDDPQIVLTIVVQDVKGLQTVTVPLAKEILSWYFAK